MTQKELDALESGYYYCSKPYLDRHIVNVFNGRLYDGFDLFPVVEDYTIRGMVPRLDELESICNATEGLVE